MGEIPQTPLPRGGRTPSRAPPPPPPPLVPSALGERRRCSMAVPLSKSPTTALDYLGTEQIISTLQLAFSKTIAKPERIPRTTH